MDTIYKILLGQLITCGVIPVEFQTPQVLRVDEYSIIYHRGEFGEIKIDNDIGLDLLKNVLCKYVVPQKVNQLIQQLPGIQKYRDTFDDNVIELIQDNNITFEQWFNSSPDFFYNVACRFVDREAEYLNYILMFRNELPERFKIDRALQVDIPFISSKYNDDNVPWVTELEGGFPVHPLNITDSRYSLFSKKRCCFFSTSHRTFTFPQSDYYFKIDLPCVISSKKRVLTRSQTRLKASKFALSNIHRFNSKSNMKLWILPDLKQYVYEDINCVVRKKTCHDKMIPLFALFKKLPWRSEGKDTILDILIHNQSLMPLEYALKNIVYPIMDVLEFFVSISTYKFVAPYNFHRQNINLVLKGSRIIGIAVQDLDMSNGLNATNFFREYDSSLTLLFFSPLCKYLKEKYDIDVKTYISSINNYYHDLFDKYSFLSDRTKERFHLFNLWESDGLCFNNKSNIILPINEYRK